MAKKAKVCDDYFKEQVARIKQQQIEEDQKKVEEAEERRKKEELSIENIPKDGVLSSPVTGKTVRKPQPHASNKTQTKSCAAGSQKPTTTTAPRPAQVARSQPQSQSQSLVNKPNIEQQSLKRKANQDWELTEKLNRVIKQSKTERIENRKKEIGYKTTVVEKTEKTEKAEKAEKTEKPRHAAKY